MANKYIVLLLIVALTQHTVYNAPMSRDVLEGIINYLSYIYNLQVCHRFRSKFLAIFNSQRRFDVGISCAECLSSHI